MTQHYTDTELMTWRPAKNTGSVAINPREVCKVVTGGDSLKRSIVAVQQPDSTAGQSYCVNGPMTIPPGGFGRVCFDPVVLVAYDSGTPAIDEAWGWKAGQGTVSKGSNPRVTVMRIVDSTAKVMMGRWVKGNQTPMAWGTTTTAVATGDASFNVSSVDYFDGTTWPGSGNLFVSNVPDAWKASSVQVLKLVYCHCSADSNAAHNADGTTTNAPAGWNWHPYDAVWTC